MDFVKATVNVNGNVHITDVSSGGGDGKVNLPVENCWYKVQEWKYLG